MSAVLVEAGGAELAVFGEVPPVTWWRSAAKPFQALPLVADGGVSRFGLGAEEIAITCASHSSEPAQLAVVDSLLARVGGAESDLACGPHPPLSPAVRDALIRQGISPTPRYSNCSGKHAGMVGLARLHGWPVSGYVDPDHPVQRRILGTIAEWTGVPGAEIATGVDGCAAPCFGLPLAAMARAWARFGVATEPAARAVRQAMMDHPSLVAGTGRSCTAFMLAWPGRVVAKIGAEGVYGAAVPERGVGVALKVEDGDMRAAGLALAAVLRALLDGNSPSAPTPAPLAPWVTPPIRNTRGAVTGEDRVIGDLVFLHRSA